MRKDARAAAAAMVTAGAAACQLLAGIEQKEYAEATAADARDATDAGAPTRADPCTHASPPPPPENDDPVTKNAYLLAMSQLAIVQSATAEPAGYDLDDTCTCFAREGTRHDGSASCVAASAGPCDADGGVDNALSAAFASRPEFIPIGQQLVINTEIRCGTQGMLLYLSGYNGTANDQRVELSPVLSNGIYSRHVGGELDAGCAAVGDGGPYPPKWDGTDSWTYDPRSVYEGSGFVPIRTGVGYVSNWQLVVRTGGSSILVTFRSLALEISAPTVTATLVPVAADGGALAEGATRGPAFKLVNGVISGRVATRALLTSLASVRVGTEFLCGDSLLYKQLKSTLCPVADIMADPLRDFLEGSRCDAISIGATFSAAPAVLGAKRKEGDLDAGCGAAWSDDCDVDGSARAP